MFKKFISLVSMLVLTNAVFAAPAPSPGRTDNEIPVPASSVKNGICTLVVKTEASTWVVSFTSIKYLNIASSKPNVLNFVLHGYINERFAIGYKTDQEALTALQKFNQILQECPKSNL